jgi:ubiquinone/menaquinone biosynthesis C-methylase UbiE
VHFAAVADDPEKTRQQAVYDGWAPDTVLELPYRDVDGYRDYCTNITGIVRQLGIDGRHFKALKTRQVLDRLRPRSGERVLDVGSGAGSTLALLTLHYGAKGTGIDISSAVIERCAQENPWGHEYYQADAEQLPFLDNTFDGIISMDVLEHLPHPARCIAEAARVVRPGGWAMFYAVSQRDAYTWHWTQRRLTGDRVGADCGAGHRWERFLQPDQARTWMEGAGFAKVRVTPFHALTTLILDERLGSLFTGLVRFPWLPRILLGVADLADLPLTSRGFGNGFYVEGRKGTDEPVLR